MTMKKILSKLSRNPSIPHFHIRFPLRSKAAQQCLAELYKVSNSSAAVFVSLNGISQNPEISSNLHEALTYITEKKRMRVHTFLQDNINGIGYYIAAASTIIIANPFCRMGDLTSPIKSYININKLLKYFGIEYSKIGSKDISLWDKRIGPSESQKQFTKHWLQLIKNKLKTNITIKRQISSQVVEQFGSKVMQPKKALELKLIDKIGTLNQYKDINFPNNKVKEHQFFCNPIRFKFKPKQIQVLGQIIQYIQLPNIVLMRIDNGINECIKNFIEMIEDRLNDPYKLEELDWFVGEVLMKAKMEIQAFDESVV